MPARESLDLICSCVCVCGEVKDCCVYKNRREKKLPGSCCCCCARLAAFAGRQIYQVDAKLHVCLLQRDARALSIRLLPSSAHTHTRNFFSYFIFLFFARLPSGTGLRRCRYEGGVFWSVHLFACVWATNWSEAISWQRERENFRGEVVYSANLNKVTNHTLTVSFSTANFQNGIIISSPKKVFNLK
jgi:hypothetical protein